MPDLQIIPDEVIVNKIYQLRGYKIMIDSDLSLLYGVTTKRLNEQVKRNINRFPDDFMFQLTKDEVENLRSQIATSSWGGSRYLPYAFTEQGVAMLSSVLNSEVAINVNIRIIRLFTKLRETLMTNKDLLLRMEQIETELAGQGESIEEVFSYLDQLIQQPQQAREKIGFKLKHEE